MTSSIISNLEDLIKPDFKIIQGGMGAGVSDWRLARTVSKNGALGVVSGTAIDAILARRLQLGDPEGNMRKAMNAFPFPEISDKVWDKYFIEGGKSKETSFKAIPMYHTSPRAELLELTVLANFVEVFLAKEDHKNPVGTNYLEKIQMPHLPSIYGAMLADVDFVLMGAGIPRQIPGVLSSLTTHEPVSYILDVKNTNKNTNVKIEFNPRKIGEMSRDLHRPEFLAIISSNVLAKALSRSDSTRPEGFIIEGPTAGGHNAPPRNSVLDKNGEPIYGPKDTVDLDKIASIGLPFWLAGGYGNPKQLENALASGADGIQVGTLFSLCEESGIDKTYKQEILTKLQNGSLAVYTDPVASPTGFPFKVVQLDGTMSQQSIFEERKRVCDLGYLRNLSENERGTINYTCPSEPISAFIKKGGNPSETTGRKCVCNALMANIGLGQKRNNGAELPLITSGDSINNIRSFIKGGTSYSAVDVLNHLNSQK